MELLRRKAKHKIRREFQRFKRKCIYRMTKQELWDACEKVHFYCCVQEYFDLKDQIPAVYLKLVLTEPLFLDFFWRFYLQTEKKRYQTWEELEVLLDAALLAWNPARRLIAV